MKSFSIFALVSFAQVGFTGKLMLSSTSTYAAGRRNAVFAGILLPALTLVAGICGFRFLSRKAFLAANFFLLYPTLRRNSRFFGPIATRFKTDAKEVWLTIDDGPDPRDTPEILNILKAHEAKASFFCIGKKALQHPELCKRMISEGHTVENHSFDHPSGSFWAASPARIRGQIQKTSAAIKDITGVAPRYFRSPAGMTNPFVHPELRRQNLILAGWSCSGFDGIRRSTRRVLSCLLPDVRPGAIILLHEGSHDSQSSSRVRNLELLMQYLSQRGYRCVLPSEASLV